jgi:predicted metal-dependent hydrolase
MAGRGLLSFLMGKPPVTTKASMEPFRVETRYGPCTVSVIRRNNARRMILRLDRRSGGACLTLPRGVPRREAERFVIAHLSWLETRLAQRPERIAFEPGQIIPFRGEPHRIIRARAARAVTRMVRNELGEAVILVGGLEEAVPGRVLRFLRAEALAELTRAAHVHAGTLGVTVGRISIRDTISRWGSCSSRGDLSFSWRLILAPSFVLSYLAAHEVAHRLEMNHSARFWRHVRRLDPDFRQAESWLNQHGASLHHFGP